MTKRYDIVARLAAKNAKPSIQVTEDIAVTVNNSKTTALHFMAIEKDENLEDLEKMDKLLAVALGKKQFESIEALELTFPAYSVLFEAVAAALSGEDLDEAIERFQEDAEE